ncbi:DUF805 domain-containing protein [Sphingomonas immobilis]|uniref:DUF805 domain-containing protein n=1 Tax=Sphingomonas immobilis TaxID=3063997 RepID=A0ABT8ZTL7_9SPHN|nr:DUF805 domain-containing protein [Sphingomonas sp. CA1-15]MDO7840897.1 DUF805 domain-containing protein [Sphingomonas sp. CA1-15]
MEYMLMPLKRYADFEGRSRRTEYWMFVLGIFIVSIVIGVIAGILGAILGGGEGGGGAMVVVFGLFGIFALGLIVPSIAVQVRRFHDQDKSGWFVLLGLIPYVGGLVVLVFMCLPGTVGPNKFGPDPKGDGSDVIGGGVMAARPDLR